MPYRVCTRAGCGTLHQGTGMCPSCRSAADKQRRPEGNPYVTRGHQRFRAGVLARDPYCVCQGDCGHHTMTCGAPASIADHYPHERVDLVTMGLDPNDPRHGRGLCPKCHNAKTARTRPGGWNSRIE